MTKKSAILPITLCFCTLVVTGAGLKNGTWKGTVTPPNGNAIEVTYDVAEKDGAVSITLNSPMGAIAFEEIEMDDDAIHFSWNPGDVQLTCELKLQEDQSYAGTCTDPDGGVGHLTMVPPM